MHKSVTQCLIFLVPLHKVCAINTDITMDEDFFALRGIRYNIDMPEFEGTDEDIEAQKNQYVKDFVSKIPIGSVFTLMMEPENPFDNTSTPAIAVYYNYKMLCYVQKEEKDIVLPYLKDAQLLKIKYTGEIEDGYIYLSTRNRLKIKRFCLDNIDAKAMGEEPNFKKEAESKVRFNTSAIGFSLTPYFQHEEIGMLLMAEDVARGLDYIMNNDWEDEVTLSVAGKVADLLNRYSENAYCSLSTETSYAYQFIFDRLKVFCARSEKLKEKFKVPYSSLQSIFRRVNSGVLRAEVFQRQLDGAATCFKKKNTYRLYNDRVFHNGLAPTTIEIDEQTRKIKDWLGSNLPSGIFEIFKSNQTEFAKQLSDAKLHMKDLYMVYAHLSLLGYNKMLHDEWQDDPKTTPAQIVYNSKDFEIDFEKIINNYINK